MATGEPLPGIVESAARGLERGGDTIWVIESLYIRARNLLHGSQRRPCCMIAPLHRRRQ